LRPWFEVSTSLIDDCLRRVRFCSTAAKSRKPGQAAFELVVILPIFLAVMLLVVDFGIVTWEYISVANAVREGGRFGTLNCPTSGVNPASCTPTLLEQRVLDRSDGILTSLAEVDTWWCRRGGSTLTTPVRGDSIIVRVERDYPLRFAPGARIPVRSMVDMLIQDVDLNSTVPQGSVGSPTHPC
jgi:hypothetical protein